MTRLPDLHRHFLTLLPRNYWLLRNVVDRHLEPMGLSSAQWRPLLVLNDAPEPMTQVQLARALGLEAPTVVRLLDRLVEGGWAQRHNCPQDRRAYRLALTASGRALCEKIEPVLADLRQQVLGEFTAAELTRAVQLMDQLHQRLSALDAGEHSGKSKAHAVQLPTEPGGPSNRMRRARPARRTRTSR